MWPHMIIYALVHAAYDTCLYLCENDKFANLREIPSGFDMRFRDWRQSSRETLLVRFIAGTAQICWYWWKPLLCHVAVCNLWEIINNWLQACTVIISGRHSLSDNKTYRRQFIYVFILVPYSGTSPFSKHDVITLWLVGLPENISFHGRFVTFFPI